jgi:hypothetical protein
MYVFGGSTGVDAVPGRNDPCFAVVGLSEDVVGSVDAMGSVDAVGSVDVVGSVDAGSA